MAMYLGLAALAVVVLVVVVAMRPAGFRIERTRRIAAPAEVLYPLICDFHEWVRWSPYEKFDPQMSKSFDGPASGEGASYAWSGNKHAGEGRVTVVECRRPELVRMQLDFDRPFRCSNEVNFLLVPAGAGTDVTWRMDGRYNTVTKVMSLLISMDRMVGGEFDAGLANLDALAQSRLQPAAEGRH